MGFPSQFSDVGAPAASNRRDDAAGAAQVVVFFAVPALLVLTVAVGFLRAAGDGRAGEIFLLGVGILLAYAAGHPGGALVALGLTNALLALEAHYGRLDRDHLGGVLLFACAFAGAAFASAQLRMRFEIWNGRAAPSAAVEVESLDLAVDRALQSGETVSLLVVRPDGLPELAELYGPDAARVVLGRVSGVLRELLGEADQLLRHSLFDFWAILPGAHSEVARTTAERIRLGLLQRAVEVAPEQAVAATLSAGVASSPRDGAARGSLLEAAQRALDDAAIELGGNRTLLHSIPPGAPAGWGLRFEQAGLDSGAEGRA